jgi:septal ring factor EnvC (AmiA/AmiB activator)
MSPALDERDRIRAAMDRIFAGTAEYSTGARTIVALAQEAQVPRNALTQRHVDLKNAFYDRIRDRKEIPETEQKLRSQLAKLRKLRAAEFEELQQLRLDNENLVGTLHQVQMENRQLRQQLAEGPARLRALPAPQPPLPPA